MRWFLLITSGLSVIALAFWAYSENYRTQQALRQAETVQNEIGALRERLGVLRAEWAYLNRPNRLRELADINFDKLGLLPLRPDHFGRIDEVAFPKDQGIAGRAASGLDALAADEGSME